MQLLRVRCWSSDTRDVSCSLIVLQLSTLVNGDYHKFTVEFIVCQYFSAFYKHNPDTQGPTLNTEDIPVSPSPVEELPRITATYNELQEVKSIEASIEQSSPQHRVTLADQPQPPLLNRAQRRVLRKYIRHKAALQVRHVLAKRRKMAVKQAKIAKALAKQAKYVAGIIS